MQPSSSLDHFRQRFPLVVPVQVRFRDLDALGHVNNAVYLTYLETARVLYVRQRFHLQSPRDFTFILARVEIDYRRPLTLGDCPLVGIGVAQVGQRSFRFVYEIWEETAGVLVAQALTVQVMYDYQTNRSVPIPSEVRARLTEDLVSEGPQEETL